MKSTPAALETLMQSFSALLRAEPISPDAVHARLETLGFAETPEEKSDKKKTPSQRAFSGSRRRTRIAAASTPIAAAARSTTRALKLIEAFSKSDVERAALFAILDELLEDLSRAADPLKALLNFSRLCDAGANREAFFQQLKADAPLRVRLTELLGFAQSLADTLIRDPELIGNLSTPAAPVSRPGLRRLARDSYIESTPVEAQLNALRRFRRHQTFRIGLLDMERATWRNADEFHLVVRQISDLAQVCVQETLRLLSPEDSAPFCVLAMGKMGARELNYSSDIDLIFLHDGETAQMNELGQSLFKALNDASADGALYRVDMRLRPEGSAGPLVTPFDYALSYYESYAAAWEWQALIKTRGVAGDAKLARRFRRFTREITWARRSDDGHLRDIVEMKRRSESTAEGADSQNVKQGPGAIRDAEWIVQQLQMMIGPTHPKARAKDTLRALGVLASLDTLSPDEARILRDGYLFLRVLEHRLQLWEEQAIRRLPESESARAALSRRMGCAWKGASASRWLTEEHDAYRAQIRALCEKLFWGWREENAEVRMQNAEMSGAENSAFSILTSALPLQRLAEGTSTHPLPAPLSRQIKAVLPAVIEAANHAADPQRAISNLERLAEASGNRLSLLRSLADTPELARGVLTILGGSQFLTDTLVRFPELLDLASQRTLIEARKTPDAARADCRAYCLTFRDRRAALRRWKAREMLRIGLRDLVLDASPHDITGEIAALCGACLDFATGEVGALLRPESQNIAFGVLGMGKLGGGEMHYSSDADVIFAHENFAPTGNVATRWAEELIQFMGARTEDGIVFETDARLRPEGRNGALAPSFQSFLEYFERAQNGLQIWERQALTRARFVAGDAALSGKLMAAIRHVAFPQNWQSEWSDELRHIKTRVETERGAKAKTGETVFDVKIGKGGLSDIEWTTQWLALKWGAKFPVLQTRSTLFQIEAAREAGVLQSKESDALRDTYTFLRRAELRLQIAHEYSAPAVRKNSKEWTAWTRAVFPDETGEIAAERFEEEWEIHTKAAREVFEKVRDEL